MLSRINAALGGVTGEVITKLVNLILMVCVTICALAITYSFM